MQKYLFILSMIYLVLCISCGDQNLDEISIAMGEEYMDNSSGIVITDTLSLTLSTVILDSVSTSSTNNALVGTYDNEYLGKVSSEAIVRFSYPDGDDFDEDEDVFDSIVMCLKHNDYYIGDTTELIYISIHELSSDLEDITDDSDAQSTFYNTTNVSTSRLLGEYTYYPEPEDGDTIFIRLDDDFGQEIFDLFVTEDDTIETTEDFQDYFKGIVIKGDDSFNQNIIGYNASDTTMCMKMYYHRVEDKKTKLTSSFNADESVYQFNSIDSDRSSSTLSELTETEEALSSSLTEDLCFIQGGSGLVIRVDFPGLTNYYDMFVLNTIIKAELILTPVEGIEDDINELPSYLSVYETNIHNEKGSILYSDDGDILYMYLYDESTDDEHEYYYSIDITDQVIDELLNDYWDPDYALMIDLPSSYAKGTTTSLYFGGHNNIDYVAKLKIYTYYY